MAQWTKIIGVLLLLGSSAWAFPGAEVGTQHGRGTDAAAEIARIASASADSAAETFTSFTVPVTIPAGDDVVLLMPITVIRAATTPLVTAVTYNGSATGVTQLGTITATGAAHTTALWYLKDPLRDGTSHNVVFTIDNAAWVVAGAVAYEHVDQTTPFGTPATTEGTSTSPSVTVSSDEGEVVFAHCGHRDDERTLTTHVSQDEIYNRKTAIVTAENGTGAAGSDEAGAASVVMSYTISGSEIWTCLGVSLVQAN